MNKLIICLLTFFLIGSTTVALQAQVSSESKSMSEGVYEALVLNIPDLNQKQTSKLWASFTKDFYNARSKQDRRSKEYIATDAKISGLSRGQEANLHATFEDRGNGSVIFLWARVGGQFISEEQNPDAHMEAEKILLRFGLEAAKEKIRLDIEAQEKDLKGLEGDLKKLENEKTRHERDIEKAEQTIKDAEAGIEQNVKDQEAKNKEIDAQRELIEATKKKLNDI